MGDKVKRFQLAQSAQSIVTSHSGLTLIGLALNRHTHLQKDLLAIPKRHGIPTIDYVRTYVGQLCLAQSDFEAVENHRYDRYFKRALDIKHSPSASRLRQRFDEDARQIIPIIDQASVDFITSTRAPVTPMPNGFVALDMDVFPMDNSKTAKEGVSRTYKQYDGYAPIGAYLGNEGWALACELREGSQHSQNEFIHVLERVIPRARTITSEPLLVRLDGAHDAKDNREWLGAEGVDYLIKWNPRRRNHPHWLEQAEQQGQWQHPREGKRVAVFSIEYEEQHKGQTVRLRRVMRITERTIDRHGQAQMFDQLTVEGWNTSLNTSQADDQAIIALYRDHATSEQFHSEFKTDLDIERLPSGKFDTNDLVLAQAMLAYNILRWIGLMGLTGELSPVRHPAKRRRLRTVMQELMYLAARVVRTARQWRLDFSVHCPGFEAFAHVHRLLLSG